jgi:uncharacterized membrane protein
MESEAMEERTLDKSSDEDRILRIWTPFLLRTILIAASIILLTGLFLMLTSAPGFYVERYHAAQQADFVEREPFTTMIWMAAHGYPHSLLTVGLFVLTLVPLARVAFCFLLFIKESDYAYVGFTAYVLAGLIVGVLLGRIG